MILIPRLPNPSTYKYFVILLIPLCKTILHAYACLNISKCNTGDLQLDSYLLSVKCLRD